MDLGARDGAEHAEALRDLVHVLPVHEARVVAVHEVVDAVVVHLGGGWEDLKAPPLRANFKNAV